LKNWICKEQKSRQVTTTLSAFEPISTPFQSGLVVLLEKIKSEGTRVLNREWVTAFNGNAGIESDIDLYFGKSESIKEKLYKKVGGNYG
jgi:hypothetical protein